MRNSILTFFLVLFTSLLMAQPEFGLNYMRHTLQASKINPALIPEGKFIISLPHIYNNLEITGPTFGDLVRKNDAGETVFNVDEVLSKLEDENLLRENSDIETFGIAFGAGPFRISVGHTLRFGAYLNYPKTLPSLIWNGNAQFIGQTVDLDHNLQIMGYNEFALGAAFKWKVLTLGAKLKLLSGIGDISTTNRNSASLYTDDDIYQLTFSADYLVNSSSYIEYEGFRNAKANIDFGAFQFDKLFTKNTGLAFDLGANLELGKLNLSASMLDIGKINWTEEVNNYSSNGSFTYDGLDISTALSGGDTVSFGDALDTLEQIFQVVETHDEYSTDLPSKIYLAGTFQLTDVWLVGASFYQESYRDKQYTGISFGAQAGIKEWITLGANYSIYGGTYSNFGINATSKLGPVQLVLATDNILAAFQPKEANFSNVRAGLNLVF